MKSYAVLLLLAMAGCAYNDARIKEAVRNDPKIVFDTIEEHPEEFMDVVTRAAQKAKLSQQQKQNEELRQGQRKDLAHPKEPKLSADRRLFGGENGKIVVVEYADFQCPACGMNYQPLKQFLESHVDQVQFYFKNMPLDFHPMALPAAHYFEAVRLQSPKKALKFYDLVFSRQRELKDEKFLQAMAVESGADLKKIDADLRSGKIDKILEEDQAEFNQFGFSGTPSLILNGVALVGAQPLSELERVAKLTLQK